MRLAIALFAVASLGVVGNTEASLIAATNFDGRTVSGATASNLVWTVNGVADPGSLTASANLFDTPSAQNLFAVRRNIVTQGPWSVDIALNVGSSALVLDTVTLDAYILNNNGAFQSMNRDLDLTIELLSGISSLDSDSANNVYPNNGVAPSQPQPVTFDLSGNTLASNTNYILRITASGNGSPNNAGFDNLVINGTTAVPEPATIAIWSALAGIGVICGRCRRREPR